MVCVLRHVDVAAADAGSLVAILSEVEELKASADLLESELAEVSKAAEVAAKRSRRLAARSHELQVSVVLRGGGGRSGICLLK